MRKNQSVLSHRACGFAAGSALTPGIGLMELFSPSRGWAWQERDKVMAGGTPANPAALVSVS
jgi:hypothetical protein